jgi:hypothetical protein
LTLPYITKEEVRDLTGTTEIEVGDSELDQIITDAENLVEAYTGKSWAASESEYSKIQTATRFVAASLIYESLPVTPETNSKSQRYHEKAMAMLKVMRLFGSGPLRVA